MPHALLFHGPEGSGKAAAALELARSLHCEQGGEGTCGACRGCGRTAALNHPDFSVLFPFTARVSQAAEREALQEALKDPYGYALPEEAATISIDRIRALQKQFAYGAFEGVWRTAVFLHADRMRPEGANALLKTLEEPPGRSLLILVAPGQDALLPTVVSRCQGMKFTPLASRDVAEDLAGQAGVEADRAWFIARACGGNLRLARQMAGAGVEEAQDRAYRFLEALVWGEEPRTYAALEQLAADREAAMRVLSGAVLWLRDALVYGNGGADRVSHRGREEEVRRLSEVFGFERLLRTVQKVESIREMSHRNVNLHLGLVSLWRAVHGA